MVKETDIRGTHVWLVLSRASSAVGAHANRHIESFGFCASDFGILECLLHKGALPVNVIGRKILLTSGSITSAIDRLEKKGLVARNFDPEDRRTRLVDLTNEGRALIKNAFAEHERVIETAVAILSASERKTLIGLLRKLGHYADMERGHPARNGRDASEA
jgi:MarR family 2-MHQ and catechol resistance regulon transcriptional repressor